MKKLFSLVAFALITTLGVNAQTWSVGSSAPNVNSTLVDNELVEIKTVYATTRKTQSGDNALTGDYSKTAMIQVRTGAKPDETTPTGTENSGSTPLVITAKKDISVTFYYRRQNDSNSSGVFTNDNGKDMLCYAQNGKEFSTDEELIKNIDNSYGNVKKTCKFYEGGIYTMYATGTTIGLFCLDVASSVTATDPTFTPDGGDIMALSTIILTSDGAVYYQWSDEIATPEISVENWTKGTSVTVPNEVGTKYLHAYATNGEGLESNVVTKEFNITELVLTAETNKTWDFTDKTNWPNQKLEFMFYNDNLIINANSEKTVEITANGLNMGGAPNAADNRTINIKVAPRTCIKVSYASGNASSTRYLNIDKDVYGTNIAKTATDAGNTVITEINHTGKEDATLIIYGTGGGIIISKIEVEPMPTTDTKEVTSNGWATYIPVLDAQFEENTAYIVTNVNTTTGVVTIENVTEVPANTAVLLKGEGTKTITYIESADALTTTNLLEVYAGEQEGKVAYVLAKDGDSAGFKKWTGDASDLTGRVVLWLDETQTARGFFALDGEATGIKAVVTSVEDGTIYDLQGRRVAQPKSGLYIVNGKKVVVK